MLNPVVSGKMRREAGRREKERNRHASRVILHVDMDAFFAAVEERDNPSLRGRPVIIGGPKGSRGIVTTCNYRARRFGVSSGMSLAKAGLLCPDGIYLKTHGRKYTWVSLRLMELLRRFSPQVEPYSVDEAFLDASGCTHLWGGPEEYGKAVKRAISGTLGLTASVGIGPSRVVAKIASGLEKPDGLTIIEPERVREVLGPLPVEAIPGVGEATKKALNSIGIYSFSQLAEYPPTLLRAVLGVNGEALSRVARGEGGDKVVGLEERPDDKSMGHDHTFSEDVESESVLHGRLLHLCDKAARRMRKENYVGNVVTLRLRTADFRTFTHRRALGFHTSDPVEIFQVAKELLAEIWREGDYLVRLIGVSVSHLVRLGTGFGVQEHLFKQGRGARNEEMYRAIDFLRDLYGEDILEFAGGMKQLRTIERKESRGSS